MDENRKDAYRYLLYRAMLDIRKLQREDPVYTPMVMAELANWLHSLAYFSCIEFDGFKEDMFWRRGYFSTNYPDIYSEYRQLFTARLNGVGWLGDDKKRT